MNVHMDWFTYQAGRNWLRLTKVANYNLCLQFLFIGIEYVFQIVNILRKKMFLEVTDK